MQRAGSPVRLWILRAADAEIARGRTTRAVRIAGDQGAGLGRARNGIGRDAGKGAVSVLWPGAGTQTVCRADIPVHLPELVQDGAGGEAAG
ncbi:hypothetical protein GCM10017710_17930 [Arthrobacter ramosus]